jgi:hypothetical protein
MHGLVVLKDPLLISVGLACEIYEFGACEIHVFRTMLGFEPKI